MKLKSAETKHTQIQIRIKQFLLNIIMQVNAERLKER